MPTTSDITVYETSQEVSYRQLPNSSEDEYCVWKVGTITKREVSEALYITRSNFFIKRKFCLTKQEAIDHIKSMYKQTMRDLDMEVEQARLAYEEMKAVLETEQKKEAEHLAAIENLEVINAD